jgi:hypothetical protein
MQGLVLTSRLDPFGGAVPLELSLLLPSPLSLNSNFAEFALVDLSGGTLFVGPVSRLRTSQVNLVEGLSYSRGKHQMKFGVDWRMLHYADSGSPAALAYFSFSTSTFLNTGQVDAFAYLVQNSARFQLPNLSLYGQDTWKITRRLNLTYGLRWEIAPPPSPLGRSVLGAWENTDNPQIMSLAPLGTPLWKTNFHNFGPRIGAAYSLTPNGDFVLRGGFGMFYDLGSGTVAQLAQEFPQNSANVIVQSTSLPLSNPLQYAPSTSVQPPYGGIYTTNFSAFSNRLQLPRSYQWNVAAEKSFGKQQAVSVTYVGQAGRQLLRQTLNLIEGNPNFVNGTGSVSITGNGDTSDYNALQLQYRRSLYKNLQMLLNYTYSHCLDSNSDDGNVIIAGSTLLSASNSRGSCVFDVRHNFSGAMTYSLPSIARERFLHALSRDWSLDSVVLARSGFPIAITYTAPFLDQQLGPLGGAALRPDRVAGAPIWISAPNQPAGKLLNPAAFDTTTPNSEMRQGNLPRNAISGFGATQVDFSVLRKFPFTERIELQFRADMFNVFNHPNFKNPNGNLDTVGGGFGTTSSTLNNSLGGLNALYQFGGPRSLQLSLKLVF